MAHSEINQPVTLPFPEYKWQWAEWTVREIFKSPELWIKVIRVMYKFEGSRYALDYESGRLFHDALTQLGLRDDRGVPISFTSSDRSFLRGYKRYWTNVGVLIPPDQSNSKINLTPLGQALATGKMNFQDYVTRMVKLLQFPNPIIQENVQSWLDNASQTKPLALILETLVELFTLGGYINSYLTEREVAILVYPLSSQMNASQIANEIIAWREGDPSFDLSLQYVTGYTETNHYRNIKEFLQFLSAGNYLIQTELTVKDFNINRNQQLEGNVTNSSCYFLNILGKGKWNQLSTTDMKIEELRELIENARGIGFHIPDINKSTQEQKLDYINYLTSGVTIQSTIDNDYEPDIDDHLQLLQESKQIILSGPPGTGKTRLALQIAQKLQDAGQLGHKEMILFHQSYSYEDFIEGIRPNVESTSLSYTIKHGLFKSIAKKAIDDPDKYYILIIDEINRGNISNIFGELIFLLEPSYRHSDYAVELQYTGDLLWVPDNLLLIGTMNSTDKSAIDLDLALRRRFSIIRLLPNTESINSKIQTLGITLPPRNSIDLDISASLTGLNNIIDADKGLGEDYCIGQAFFIPRSESYDEKKLLQIWNYKIIPLLNEYLLLSPTFKNELSDYGFFIRGSSIKKFDLDSMYQTMKQLSEIAI